MKAPGFAGGWLLIYDSLGRKQDEVLGYSTGSNGYHHFTYDLLNRLVSDTLYDSGSYVYGQATVGFYGNETVATDGRGNSTSRWADVAGRLRQVIDASPGGTTNLTYDSFGNLVQTVDATGATTTYQFDVKGVRTSLSAPDTGSWAFVSNSFGELVSRTDAKGQTTSFTYDALGRMTSRLAPEFPTPTVWNWGSSAGIHNVGFLDSVTAPDGYAESYAYDGIGRVATKVYTVDGTPYQYDLTYNNIGATDVVTYPMSTSGFRFAVKNTYSYGVLVEAKDNSAGTVFWALTSVDDRGSPTSETLGNGASIASGYSPWTGEVNVRSVGTGGSTTNLQNLSYTWDVAGNLQQRQDLLQGLTETFVNDPLNRLSSSTLNGVPTLAVGYDAAGNITSKSDVGAYDYSTAQGACSYYGHAQPHAVRNAGGSAYCYDQNGNVTSRGGGAISWYSFNLPYQISNGGNTTEFNYDANYRRWKQTANYGGVVETTRYVGNLLEVVSKNGVTEYRHQIPAGTGLAVYTRRDTGSSDTYYVTTDHLGSGDLVMDSGGTVLARQSYSPFGTRRGSNWQGIPTVGDYAAFAGTTRRGFTGHEMLDSVGLVHMNGRVYDPVIGRFLQPDPVVQTIALSQALNPYSYVMNNPLGLVDPSGYFSLKKAFKSIGNFFQKWGGTIISIGFAIAGMPFIGAMISSAFGTAVNGGSFGSFARGFAIGVAAGYVAGPVAGRISTELGMNAASIGTQVFRGALGGGIGGGISSSVQGGSFWDGFEGGALSGGATAAVVSTYWSYKTEQFIKNNVNCAGGCNATVLQAMREGGMSAVGQRFMKAYTGKGSTLSIFPESNSPWGPGLGPHVAPGTDNMYFDGNVHNSIGSWIAGEPWGPSMNDATTFIHELGHTLTGFNQLDEQINLSISENLYRTWMGSPARNDYALLARGAASRPAIPRPLLERLWRQW